MVHVTPVPHAPSIPRQKPQYSGGKGKGSGLAVHVSTVAAQLGSTITGWLVSELTAKSAQSNMNSRSCDARKSVGPAKGEPKAVFYTPQLTTGPPSPEHLGIPLGPTRSSFSSPNEEVPSEEEVETVDDSCANIEMPRIPPPVRTSPPPPEHNFPAPRKSPTLFTESLPIAPKQLLPPIQSAPVKSVSQRKPTPIQIIPAPDPKDEPNHLPTLPMPYSNFPIPYVSALDSPPSSVTVPPAPLVPSSPRFSDGGDKPQYSPRPSIQRSLSSADKDGFAFDFPPVIPEKDIPRAPVHRRPKVVGRRSHISECMQDFIDEYVEMRRKNVNRMARNQRFPVAGQLMSTTSLGSVYSLVKEV